MGNLKDRARTNLQSSLTLVFASAALGACARIVVPAYPDESPSDAARDDTPSVGDSFSDAPTPDASDSSVPAVQLMAPLSGSVLFSSRPTLRWSATAADSARIRLCSDRTLSQDCQTASVTSEQRWRPNRALSRRTWFWQVQGERRGSPEGTPTPVWEFVAGSRDVPSEAGFPTVADVNGDGRSDLLIGEIGGPGDHGRIYAFMATAAGIPDAPSEILEPSLPAGAYGVGGRLQCVDVDGDGFVDVLSVASPDVVVLMRGGPSGLRPDAVSFSDPQLQGVGGPVALGDFNGDGFGDFLVAEMNAISLWTGSPSGPPGNAMQRWSAPMGSSGVFPRWVFSTGDLDGDGRADFLSTDGVDVWLYSGAVDPSSVVPVRMPRSWRESNLPALGSGGIGDFDGDGAPDFAIAARSRNTSSTDQLAVYSGRLGVTSSPIATIDLSVGVLAAVGDMNGDGFSDFSMSRLNDPAAGTDIVRVFFGSNSPDLSATSIVIRAPRAGEGFGFAHSIVGPVGGTELDSFVVGAPIGGHAYLFSGSAGALGTAPSQTFGGESRFGTGVL